MLHYSSNRNIKLLPCKHSRAAQLTVESLEIDTDFHLIMFVQKLNFCKYKWQS